MNRNTTAGSDPITGIDDVRELNAELARRRENNQGADFIVLRIGDMSEFVASYGIEVSNGVITQAIKRIGADARFAEDAHLYRSYGLQYVFVPIATMAAICKAGRMTFFVLWPNPCVWAMWTFCFPPRWQLRDIRVLRYVP